MDLFFSNQPIHFQNSLNCQVCNLNPFDYAINKAYLDGQLTRNGLNSSINASSSSDPVISLIKKAITLLKAVSIANSTSNPTATKALGWSMSVMLISCYYNSVQCNETDFFWWYSFEYGNCYTFNYQLASNSTIEQTSQTGPTNGLTLELFTGFSGNTKPHFGI
jgi:hypothetical protein